MQRVYALIIEANVTSLTDLEKEVKKLINGQK